MKKRLHVIADTSGSMSEMGKAYLLTNLMRGVSQLLYVQHDLSQRTEYIFWSWGASLKQLLAVYIHRVVPVLRTCKGFLIKKLVNMANVMSFC